MAGLAVDPADVDDLISKAKAKLNEHFGAGNSNDLVCGIAPGRVNLIGEHTDYNDGFVLPMALPLVTVVVGRKRPSTTSLSSIVTTSEACDQPIKIELDLANVQPGLPKWGNYVKGVIANFHTKLCSFEAVIVTSVPQGGGVSSSASLEVAFYTFLEEFVGSRSTSSVAKALACQKAEHDFAGMPCGIMDQFISTMGREGHALMIDCKSQEIKHVPIDTAKDGVTFFVTNSNVKHELTGSEYPTRRKQCHTAAHLLKKGSLREASLDEVVKAKADGTLPPDEDHVVFRRARHVVTEISRTEEAAKAMEKSDFETFGALMTQSHNSLRDDFEVSCPELDHLVQLALSVKGVLGSRMTGGGFGGCTVTLIRTDALDSALNIMDEGYGKGKATFFICKKPCQGARGQSVA